MAARRLRYIESDGQVYLVRRNGVWTFPDASEPIEFPLLERHSTRILDAEVSFCRPTLAAFPSHWMFKDDVVAKPDVDPIVLRAINASLSRCVVGVLVVDHGHRVLLVRSNRGFTQGMWNVPGGFIEYGEEPERAATREVEEETGLQIRLGSLLGVYMERFQSPYFMYGFMYDAEPISTRLELPPSEIEAAEWMEPQRAFEATRNPFAQAALRKRFALPESAVRNP